ncbi:hypothetical protein PHISP_02698 [Aspergillus sp. HF37]|nr:hypothetical protein PHISP_02698 [Aspergillus sp. HF37]
MTDAVEVQSFLHTLIPGDDPNIDIIAIHGLNPKNKSRVAERSWEADDKLWLRDFLPRRLPRARILLFGYNSRVGKQSSAAGVREQAQTLLNKIWLERQVPTIFPCFESKISFMQGCEDRPILFIAYSLGGIVVKEALVQARLGEKYRSICIATFGIAFFGTPHRGSSWAGVGDIVARVASAVLRNPDNTFLNALKRDDLYGRELAANFQQLQENYWYLNFYETLPVKKIGLVVEKNSATLGLPDSRETMVALGANHETLCRFASEDDENYKHVAALLVDLASSAVDTHSRLSRQESFSSTESTLVESSPVVESPKERFCKLFKLGLWKITK